MRFAMLDLVARCPGRRPSRSAPPRHPLLMTLSASLVVLAMAASAVGALPLRPQNALAADPLISQGKTATASSVENAGTPASAAVDGNAGTRWSSVFSDPQWIQIDLGATANISQVILNWETAAGKSFQIQTSADATNWTAIYNTTAGAGGIQTLAVSGSGRYVRMYGTVRTTGYGYSLWEFQVFGNFGPTPPPSTPTPTAQPSTPTAPPSTTGCGTTNVALNKTATTSSTENAGTPASAAFDGNTGTRWASAATDPQWLEVDLGSSMSICQVVLNWEAAFGKAFQIQISSNNSTWTDMYATLNGTGGLQTLIVGGTGRYVRMYGTARGTGYGYSLWEMQVFQGTPGPTPSIAPTATPSITTPPAFSLISPTNGTMITNTRRPTMTWNAVSGTASYQVWVNISRTDYDWTASGNLLDRYTQVGTTTATSFTLTNDLSDRWTYKWYVIAVDGSGGKKQSNILQFSVYLPTVETVADGVNLINGMRDMNKDGVIEPYEDWHNTIDVRVNDLLSRMTPTEKAYQMFYNAQVYPTAGFFFGPAQPQDQQTAQLATAGTRLGIPLVTLGDTIHGYKTSYPTQEGLAATRDYNLIYQMGNLQRTEEVPVGARGVLGPLAEVDTKVLYPRFQEGNGENAYSAAAEVRALIAGLQGGPEINPSSVLAMAKHWPGEGAGGEAGIVYDAVTIKYHMIPWAGAIEANTGSIMPGYAGSSYLDPGGPGAGDSKPILDYLRNQMGYTGLITTDWLPSGTPWIQAANAGADVMGGADPGAVGFDMNTFIASVPASRIDDAVRHILGVKFRLGVFEAPYGDPAAAANVFHTPTDVALVTKAAQESMTLLKNTGVLPLRGLNAGDSILVAGARANDGPSCCIWTSYFHTEYGSQTMYQAIQTRAQQAGLNVYLDTAPVTPKVAIVIVGEPSYTHATNWDINSPFLPADQLAIIQNLRNQNIPTVVVYTMPRPYVITTENGIANAIVIAYRSGEGGGPALAGLLFGDYSPTGKLPFQLPRDMTQVGTDTPTNQLEKWDLPYDLGATDAERTAIRNSINAGQPPATTYGNPLYPYGAGIQGFGLTDTTAPTAFSPTAPANGFTVTAAPNLTWGASSDPETGIKNYQLWLDGANIATLTTTSFSLAGRKITNGSHSWYLVATNWAGLTTKSGTFSFTFSDTTAPNPFDLLAPANAASVTGATQTLVWQSASDSGGGIDHYEVWLDGSNVATVAASGSGPTTANLALNMPTVASSTQTPGNPPQAAVDGNLTTRWESAYSDPQWIYVDLGQSMEVNHVKLSWETAAASAFQIQVSNDATNWTSIYSTTTGTGGVNDITGLKGYGRYVRVYCTARLTGYGDSLWEFEVYGGPAMSYVRTGLSLAAHGWYVVAVDVAGNRRQSTSTYTFTAH